ncbi:hypothetical protein WJR50_29925 [Catalinimonas sp. 4WD22]|uniref:hypothetical protein n=1 Tax=Catalinimonas locisalis TaxID=3133978 RepID=UPI003101A5AA
MKALLNFICKYVFVFNNREYWRCLGYALGILLMTGFMLPTLAQEIPVGVSFDTTTLVRKGNFGDNWCQTWAADGNVYTMLDDGNGWWGTEEKLKGNPDMEGAMFLQISGDQNFEKEDVRKMPGYPLNQGISPFYAYGTVSVDSTIYVWLWKSESDTWYRRPVANRLLYTKDLGKYFYRWNGQLETQARYWDTDSSAFFFYKEDPRHHIDRDAYAFNWIAFCQNGQNNQAAKDDYVYMYSPEQHEPRNLSMIRVHKDHILDKSKYEYFKSWNDKEAEWTGDMKQRGVNLKYPAAKEGQEWMWASWFPSVVYNKGLDLYLMVSYGVSDPGKKFWDGWCSDCKYPASIGFWYAENPWGPWNQFYYSDYFYPDSEDNRTYGYKLSPKWISEDGKKMVLIWSDAGNNHSTYYKWNQMEIDILTEQVNTSTK